MKGVAAPTTPGASTTAPPAIVGASHSDNTKVCVVSGGEVPRSPPMENAKATVGSPSGLALNVMPMASLGFTAAVAPPPLRRSVKSNTTLASRLDDKPVVIEMEDALRAAAG
ncbi:hypothetical protein ZWY2020_020418 [Hordeum vulgare]|nr:hypothetical protein ZWY2020_020418 [Hordeum vulgare]